MKRAAMRGLGRFFMWLSLCLLGIAGCSSNMHNQTRLEPYEASLFFADNAAARPLPANTAPREQPPAGEGFFSGRTTEGDLLESLPLPLTEELIERGQTHYGIYCSPCHGQNGDGDGIIIQRGFPPPPSFHSERLRQAPAGTYFEAISQGFGAMYSYADHVPPEDRWAIIAYIRAMQSSQNE